MRAPAESRTRTLAKAGRYFATGPVDANDLLTKPEDNARHGLSHRVDAANRVRRHRGTSFTVANAILPGEHQLAMARYGERYTCVSVLINLSPHDRSIRARRVVLIPTDSGSC